jgi:hypothetical protein
LSLDAKFAPDSPLEGTGFEPSVPRSRPSAPWRTEATPPVRTVQPGIWNREPLRLKPSKSFGHSVELDHKKRAAILDKMQQLVSERVIYAPLLQLAFINGVGPRVGESGFGLIPGFAYTGPFEDITLKRS